MRGVSDANRDGHVGYQAGEGVDQSVKKANNALNSIKYILYVAWMGAQIKGLHTKA